MSPAVRVKRPRATAAPSAPAPKAKTAPQGPPPAALLRAILAILRSLVKKDFAPRVEVSPRIETPPAQVTVQRDDWRQIEFDCTRKDRGDGWVIVATRKGAR